MKYFYTHLIEIESVILELDKMDLSKKEKLYLANLIDSSLHHKILDVILSQLKDQDKRLFMIYLNERNHDKIWQFLNKRVDKVEDKIKKAVEELKIELHQDLRQARSKAGTY